MIYNRVYHAIGNMLSAEQAGFGQNRYCAEQVLLLTTSIKVCFQDKLKTCAAFIDLTVASDTSTERVLW